MYHLDLVITDRSTPDRVTAADELREAVYDVPPSRSLAGMRDLHSESIEYCIFAARLCACLALGCRLFAIDVYGCRLSAHL